MVTETVVHRRPGGRLARRGDDEDGTADASNDHFHNDFDHYINNCKHYYNNN